MNRRDILLAASAPGGVFSIGQPERANIQFSSGGHVVLTLTTDGQIKLGPDVKPDEAARRFLETLAQLYPQWLRKP
jgi:hypothetical protein